MVGVCSKNKDVADAFAQTISRGIARCIAHVRSSSHMANESQPPGDEFAPTLASKLDECVCLVFQSTLRCVSEHHNGGYHTPIGNVRMPLNSVKSPCYVSVTEMVQDRKISFG